MSGKCIKSIKAMSGFFEYLSQRKDALFQYKKYTKFIVLGRSRTGSNFLISLLRTHPEIIAHNDLFKRLAQKSCTEIWGETFTKKTRKIKYVGFKIFYYHPIDSQDRSVWDFIKNDRTIKIIHLKRNNILRAVVSRLIAEKTLHYSYTTDFSTPLTDKKISINIEDCLKEIEQTKQWEKAAVRAFHQHAVLTVNYESLSNNTPIVLNNIFAFFGLKHFPAQSTLRKQNPEPLNDLVNNYLALEISIKAAGYHAYLD